MLRALLKNEFRLHAFTRLLSTAAPSSETAAKPLVSKEAMLILRKRTGYSFVNCRKALVKFGEDNLEAAEKYLKEMALKEGWAKAAKVGGRQTSQGQCGVVSSENFAAVVELMCETDFVAKSAPFKQLVAELANGVLAHAKQKKSLVLTPTKEDGSKIIDLDPKELRTASGRTVEEAIASVIGQLGENITFKRAHLLVSHADVNVLGFTHPMEVVENVGIGRFVSAVGVKQDNSSSSGFPMEKLAYQLCQHIIGMNPTSLGEPVEQEKEFADAADDKATKASLDVDVKKDENEDLNAFSDVESTSMDENETRLLRQAFMLNPRQSVADYLDVHGYRVIDFWRIELGKSENADEKQ